MRLIKNIIIGCLAMLVFSCNEKPEIIPHYIVSKIFKSDTLTLVNVHINSRLTSNELLRISAKLKSDSGYLQNLEIHYLLPGNTEISAGEHSYYASVRYLNDDQAKSTDTVKDENDEVVRLKIFGLSQAGARRLLSLQPKEIEGKDVLGRFIDDYSHTLIIPFTNPSDKKNTLYIIEIDSTAKIVSATVPLKIADGGETKWQVTQSGDYMTLKNGILTQYAADGLGMPFNSIKSGN